MDFYTNKKNQIAQLKKDAKKNNLQAIISFLLLFAIPFLPIHILGIGIIVVFSFACGMAFLTEAIEKNTEAESIKKRYSL
jgi:predicted membrane protein